MKQTMDGQVVIVTGANSGIGFETSKALAQMGATVIMACRSETRGQAARQRIIEDTGSSKVDLMLVDLSVQQQIKQFSETFRRKYDRLDVLVNNAGAVFNQRYASEDGLEMTFALNHMGYFVLTNLLLDMLKASAPARIVNVASEAHRFGGINFNDLQSKKTYNGFGVYGESKLMNLMFTYELSRRLQATGVTVNALHPGAVASSFGSGGSSLFSVLFTIAKPFLLTPKQGAQTVIYLASDPEVEETSGKYFEKKQVKRSSNESYDMEKQQRLWQASEDLMHVTNSLQSGTAVTDSS